MDLTEALNLFGLNVLADSTEIQNGIDEKLFDLKNEVLQKYMVPRLLDKKKQQIHQFRMGEAVLLREQGYSEDLSLFPVIHNPSDRIAFLEQYESAISSLKLTLMKCRSFDGLYAVIQNFINTQENYMHHFKVLFSGFSEALPEEVNTREMIDTGALLMALKKGEPDNRQTWEIEREIGRIDKIQRLNSITT